MYRKAKSFKRVSVWCFACILVGSAFGGRIKAQEKHQERSDATVRLVFADYEELATRKKQIENGEEEATSKFERLVKAADEAIAQEPVSVLQKKRTAPSGDRHDYLTLAPYWWPNPKSRDGLPYVRRDGRVNPATRGDNVDYSNKSALFERVSTLATAGFLSEDPKYYRHAVKQLEVWFVDPETRMNPNLNYAQGIPGVNDGRCFGIIEWSGVGKIITPVQLMHASGELPDATYQSIRRWFSDYLDWLQTSEFGKQESSRLNNHGTWYDVQVVGLLLFFDRTEDARRILESATKGRVASQIEPDGRQPHELARTKSLSYSRMNLSAFKKLVALGKKVDVDLGDYETSDGRSIRRAEAFLEPYLKRQKKWPYQQL